MMKFAIVLLLFVTMAITLGFASDIQGPPNTCTVNETWNPCGACDELCSGPVVPCTRNCHIGCHCAQGFVRDQDNLCILKADCTPVEPPVEPANNETAIKPNGTAETPSTTSTTTTVIENVAV